MKKAVVSALFLSMMFVGAGVFADTDALGPDAARQAHRAEMKAIKHAQREERASAPKVAGPPSKMQSFWQKEGERSGLGNSGSRTGTFLKNLNPVPFFKDQQERYDARKKTAGAK